MFFAPLVATRKNADFWNPKPCAVNGKLNPLAPSGGGMKDDIVKIIIIIVIKWKKTLLNLFIYLF